MSNIPWGGQGGGSAEPPVPPPVTAGSDNATGATKKRGPYRPRLKGKEGTLSSSTTNSRRNTSTAVGGGQSSMSNMPWKGKGKPSATAGTFFPPDGDGRLLLSDRRLIDPASEKKRLVPTRSYTVEATAFLDIVSQVHSRDTDCPATIASDESGAERCDVFSFNCWCKDCGMHFPRLKVAATPISSVVFGILMAGSNIETYCAAHNFADIADMSKTTYYRELPRVLDAVGQVFDEVLEEQKEAFRKEGWRDMWVDTDTLYFSQHKKELEAKVDAFTGMEEGRFENSTPEDMAVGLLLTRKARNDPPNFTEKDGKTLMKGIEVAVDGSYCSRNGMTYLCNVILSAERSAPDARDRVTVPFDMVTLTRRTQKDAPLKEVCSLLRDGSTCFAHGSEAGWRQKVTKGSERETYEALNVNCYSGSGIRFSLSGQAAEPQGGRLLCLRLLLSGFYITRFKVANDVGNEMGDLFREFFTEAIELLDWAHVQRDLKCDVAKVAPGNGDRIGRDFGHAIAEALTESKKEGGLPWENGFVRKFAHITSHFQGDHQYCGNFDGGGGSDSHFPEARGSASVGGRAGGVRGKGKGGGGGKISLGDCGKSALTIASARACTEDARGHFNAKMRRMDEFLSCVEEQLQLRTAVLPAPTEVTRTLSALRETIVTAREKCVDGWNLSNGLVESLEEALRVLEPAVHDASDRARSTLPLSALARIRGNVEGLHSWEVAGKEGGPGHRETDGPAYLVTRPDIQEAKRSYMEAVDAVAKAEVLYRAASKEEIVVPVHYMDQTREGILRQEIWWEGQSWSFFSHCASSEGHTQRQHHPCPTCDLQTIVHSCLSRAFCFCTTSGTHSLDSLNASVSGITTKKGDFSRSDFAHAQIGILKRVHPRGQVGLAADVRRKLHLPELSEAAAKRVRSRAESYSHSKRGEKAARMPSRAATGEDLKRRRQSGVKKGKTAVQEAMKLNHRNALAGSLAPAGRGKVGEGGGERDSGLAGIVPAGQEEGGGASGGGGVGEGGGGQVQKRRKKSAATGRSTDAGGGSGGGASGTGVAGGGGAGAVGEPLQQAGVSGEAPQRLCQNCLGNGVPRSFLAEKAHKRKSQHCEEVQRSWGVRIREQGGNGA